MSFGVILDTAMDSMEETRFKKKHSRLINRLSKTLHLTYTELECLFLIYYKIQKDGPENQPMMNKIQFRDVLHKGLDMTDDSLMERIFLTFQQKGSAQFISMEVWAKAFSLFLYGTLQEKIDYCFSVYTFGRGKITRDVIFNLLKQSLISQSSDEDAEESVKDMIEVITKKVDKNRDGNIDYEDYKKTVLQQPQMLEVLGQCLPSRLAVQAFITSFTSRVPKV